LPQRGEHDAAIVQRKDIVRADCEGGFDLPHGRRMMARLMEDHPEQMQRIEIIGPDRKRPPINACGRRQLAGPMQSEPFGNQRRHVGRRRPACGLGIVGR
jgi:hypothetical protein